MSQGLMTAMKLTTRHVPEDLASRALAEGHVVAFTAFFERGFGVPSHRFLHSLVHYYNMELHNLNPLEIMHIATFVTLCETFMGIDPHFDLWNHFFHVQLPQGSDMEVVVLRGLVIQVKSGHSVDPYFYIPMPKSMSG
jgi:hypothetical protein